MLRAHLDIQILTDAYRAFMSDPIRQPKDFIDFAKRGCDLTLYGKPDDTELTLLSAFLEGRGDSGIWSIPHKYVDAARRIERTIPYQVFFVDISDPEERKKENQRNPFLCAYLDDYREAYKRLSDNRYLRVNDPKAKAEFKAWDDILPDLPVTDIIISDPYIFKLNQEYNPVDENFFKLLQSLKERYSLRSLLVFSQEIEPQLKNLLIEESKNILGKKVLFRIIPFRRSIEHDRYMFMNYSYLNSGSSFNYFNPEGKVYVKKASKMEFCPYSNPRNFEIAQEVLGSLYQEFRRMKENGAIPSYIDSGLFCFFKNVDTIQESNPS